MDIAKESTAISTTQKVESAHHLVEDAYDFGAKLLGKAPAVLIENPNVAKAAMIGGVLVTRGESAVAGALRADGEKLIAGGAEDLAVGSLRAASKPLTEETLNGFKSAIEALGRENKSITSRELQSIRLLTPKTPGQTGAEKLIEELKAAETPADKMVALAVYGSFNRSYVGFRTFFGQ